jgi:hypothetical protein
MSTITASRRRQRRYPVPPSPTACVEFEYPSPNGAPFRLPITNLSAQGVSFSIGDHDVLAGLEAGTSLPNAAIRVGECRVQGDLVVMHLTPRADATTICGALLYPATDTDLVKLKSVLAGMEAVRQG